MREMILAAMLIGALGAGAAAEEPATLDVWPGQAPGETGQSGPEQWQKKRVSNVSHPALTLFQPEKGKSNGVAVIVCPGGGYKALMMDYEGEDVARWLNTLGITGIVLKYRVGDRPEVPRYLPALQDAQRTVSLVRSKSKEWGIKEDKIGMLGFSAGGHLTAATSTNFDKRAYEKLDSVDDVSSRPDFAVVIYPGGLLQKGTEELSPEIRPSHATPPTFIVQANDDPVNPENSLFLYLALKHAGVPAELHIYSTGGHGFGIRPSNKPVSTWPQRCAEWMVEQGVLQRPTGN